MSFEEITEGENKLIEENQRIERLKAEQGLIKVVVQDNNYHILQKNEIVTGNIVEMTIPEYNLFIKKREQIEKEKNKLEKLTLPIDNYQENAIRFYEVQPYFYDKSRIFWFWNYEESKYIWKAYSYNLRLL